MPNNGNRRGCSWILINLMLLGIPAIIESLSSKSRNPVPQNFQPVQRVSLLPQQNEIRYSPFNGYPQISLEKKSKIVSIFTHKWLQATVNEFIVLDLETTGLDKAFDKIVEIAALRYINGAPVDKFVTLVNPQMPMPRAAQQVHRISDQAVRNSPTIEQVMPHLLTYLGSSILVGHNANFDIGFIEVWARRLGYDPCWNYIDTISVAKKMIPGLPNYKQQTVLDRIGYRQNTYHRAEDDCKGCAEILLIAINSLQGQ